LRVRADGLWSIFGGNNFAHETSIAINADGRGRVKSLRKLNNTYGGSNQCTKAGLAWIACEVNDGVSRQQQEPTSVAA
jgi:hypothetical protein